MSLLLLYACSRCGDLTEIRYTQTMNVLQGMADKTDGAAGDNSLPIVADGNGSRKRNGVYLLTCPRSASNMFQTMLAKQSRCRHSGYWFFGVFRYPSSF